MERQEPKEQPMIFYLAAEAICPECGHRESVLINKDLVIYHECNKGNRRTEVPTWPLRSTFRSKNQLTDGRPSRC